MDLQLFVSELKIRGRYAVRDHFNSTNLNINGYNVMSSFHRRKHIGIVRKFCIWGDFLQNSLRIYDIYLQSSVLSNFLWAPYQISIFFLFVLFSFSLSYCAFLIKKSSNQCLYSHISLLTACSPPLLSFPLTHLVLHSRRLGRTCVGVKERGRGSRSWLTPFP